MRNVMPADTVTRGIGLGPGRRFQGPGGEEATVLRVKG